HVDLSSTGNVSARREGRVAGGLATESEHGSVGDCKCAFLCTDARQCKCAHLNVHCAGGRVGECGECFGTISGLRNGALIDEAAGAIDGSAGGTQLSDTRICQRESAGNSERCYGI